MFRYLLIAALMLAPSARSAEPDPAKLEYFEKKVRPIIVDHCHACHAADTKPSGGLRVDDRNGLLTGGNTGAAIVPGKPTESKLIERVTQKDVKKRMPLEGQHLDEAQVKVLTKWIEDGAVWPAVKLPASFGKQKEKNEELKREDGAFQPLTNPKTPKVADAGWAKDDIDRFVLATLDVAKLMLVGGAAARRGNAGRGADRTDRCRAPGAGRLRWRVDPANGRCHPAGPAFERGVHAPED